jgi:hypothetical protein
MGALGSDFGSMGAFFAEFERFLCVYFWRNRGARAANDGAMCGCCALPLGLTGNGLAGLAPSRLGSHGMLAEHPLTFATLFKMNISSS